MAKKKGKKGGHQPKDREELARLGAALKRVREGAGFTQASLAQAAGVPLSRVFRYEQGRREPSFLGVVKLLRLMGRSPEDLLREYDSAGVAREGG